MEHWIEVTSVITPYDIHMINDYMIKSLGSVMSYDNLELCEHLSGGTLGKNQ